MATIDVLDATEQTVAIEKPLAPGRAAAASSRPVALSNEDKTALDAVATQTTAAAILAKIIAAPATEAKQDTQVTHLATIAGAVKAEDAASASGDGGLVINAKRLDTPANSSGTDGDYEPLQMSAGRLWTSCVITAVPTDPFGANADAASATGSVSAKLRGIATALGVTAFDLGVGTGGSRTQRVAIDSAQVAPAGDHYETVAASQTAQVLGATGATGDYLSGVLVIPATTSPGVVTLLDNATSIPLFVGGASSVSNLVPFFIPLGMKSVSGAFKITTGANVSAIGIGTFTA